MTGIKRILLECTGTYKTEVNTGIQRVVRNIIKESQTIGKDLEVKCLPVISRHSRLWKVDKVAGYHGQLWNNFIIYLKNVYKNFCSLLYAIFPFRPVGRFLFPAPERFGLSSIIRTVFHIAILPTTLILYFCRRKINPRKGDLLLMLDSSWAYPIWPAVKWAKAKGATVGLVVHDILPITQPHFFVPDTIERFQVWFDQAVDTADFFVTVSQTIHNEVKKYLEFRRPAVNWGDRLDSFKLGSVLSHESIGFIQ